MPQHTDDLARIEIDAHPVNGMNPAKSLVDINHLNQGRLAHAFSPYVLFLL
jgi:hypothetical protein